MNAKPLSFHAAALLVIIAASFAGSSNDQPVPAPDSTLTVPAGFSIERVAGPPLVNRPIVADFDEQGRLYVADSSGSNDKVDKQLADKPHRIVRLEDSDRDGRFDKSVVFADKMMFPEGAMWFDGSLYVAAPPSIWRLTDTNGDGVADEREEWFQGKTLTGCANDLHGPYLGPDGWIYWTKGAFAEQTYERPGKPPLVTRASHILRRKPGDPAVDIVMTGGMDNPVDVAFTATGERLLTATFVEHPQLGRRDGLIHAIYGGLYDWHTLEGPCVVREGSRYYCLYSGGCWQTATYGVDYTVADSVLGPYEDVVGQPYPRILRTIPGVLIGPGHCSIVTAPDGISRRIVYHAWDAAMTARRMYIDTLSFDSGGPLPIR